MDALAEAAPYADISRLARKRSVILATQRLAAARLADRVDVFAGGRLAELGGHAELLAAGGLYARMWAAQSGWARWGGAGWPD